MFNRVAACRHCNFVHFNASELCRMNFLKGTVIVIDTFSTEQPSAGAQVNNHT